VYSLIVSRIGYALPAWGEFVSVELCCKIDAMVRSVKCYGYTTDSLTFSDLLDKADSDLFCSMRRSRGAAAVAYNLIICDYLKLLGKYF